ncbi:hypothetical protein ACI4A4_28455, partial [Klebsiella pneumoniae]|uniref:hypothetical protein n=1 Tax=Klebsiella pneumoniae TaxID=573 RepID=UPI003854DECA
SHTSAPILNLLNLSFTSPAAPNSKIWQTSDDWNTGRLIQNLNIDFSSGVMTIVDTSRIGEFTYTRGNGSFAAQDLYGAD